MGCDTCSNFVLYHRILLDLLKNMEQKLRVLSDNANRKRSLIMTAAYFAIACVCSLQGNEEFMLVCGGIQYHIHHGNDRVENFLCVIIPLLGRFKGETCEEYHLSMSVPVTKSGLNPRLWLERVVGVLSGEKRIDGPAFYNRDGSSMKISDMEKKKNMYN